MKARVAGLALITASCAAIADPVASTLVTVPAPRPAASDRAPGADPYGSAASGVATYGDLDVLRSQNALLAEKVKNMELRMKLGGAVAPAVPAAPASAPVRAVRNDATAAPVDTSAQVQMVSGVGNDRVAIISLQNGSRVNARVGTSVPGVGVIASISLSEVTATRKSQSVSLPFAGDSNAASVTNTGPGALAPGFQASPALMQTPPLPSMLQQTPNRGVR